jgi:hypothetical protein
LSFGKGTLRIAEDEAGNFSETFAKKGKMELHDRKK